MHGESEPGKLNHRDDLFDAVKGVGIFFVVTGHLLSGTSIIQEFIAACHMPAFFFVSGYFFIGSYKKYSTGVFVQKKVKTLLIPYICWSSVSFLMNGIPYLMYRDLSGLFTVFEEIFINARSVWFLIILFFTELFCYVTKKCAQQIKCSWYIFGVACWILFDNMITKAGCWRMISIYKFEWLLPYFLLGSVCREKGILNKFQKCKMHVWSVFLWGGVYLIILIGFYDQGSAYSEFFSGYQLNICHMGYYLVYYIEGCIGILIIIMAVKMSGPVGRYAVKAGLYSLDVYVLHMFFVKIMQVFIGKLDRYLIFYNYAVVPVYSLAVVTLIILVSEHVLHKSALYKLSIGGR